MDITAFHADLMNDVAARAETENTFSANAFMTEISARMAESEEIENLETVEFDGVGSKRRNIAVHGYDLNDADGSIALAVRVFDGGHVPSTLSVAGARKHLGTLTAFLDDALSGDFEVGREESSPAYQLAQDLRMRGKNVTRYRLYLVSDQILSERAKALESNEINSVPTDFHIWDVQRLLQVSQSTQGHEELEIDLTRWASAGVPALAIADQATELTTFLAAVPGDLVADLYGQYGSRLLEGNVRSYLSNRGKVNQGIRATVVTEAEKFLSYNNGITATATGVETDSATGNLTHLRDLQIVNGGQTTASLFYVRRDMRSDLSSVHVQMKLVVVDSDAAAEMVPRISRYANSQNRVSEADFFANSPFHIRLEELSRRLLVPARAGVNYQTKWFYERARGQYQNEKNKLSTAESKRFEVQYPRSQMMTKTDAARYEVSWRQQPHMVSRGAQLNFVAFASAVAGDWNKNDENFNEDFWRALVAKGVLYNRVRKLISQSDWYEQGYLANISTYTIAKLSQEIDRQGGGGGLDIRRVWNRQELSAATETQAMVIAPHVYEHLTSRSRTTHNVSEWAKREECWTRLKGEHITLMPEFISELEGGIARSARTKQAASNQKIDSGIAAQTTVLATPPTTWRELRAFCVARRLAASRDLGVLDVALRGALPTEKQSAVLLQLLMKAEEHGFSQS
jgi:hypothetical protein